MTFYQELQLDQVGSKAYISSLTDPKEKRKHTLIYLFKILLTVAFCVVFVTIYTKLFGENNSIVGVVVLLSVMVFRYADMGIQNQHGAFSILIIFGILAFGPVSYTHLDVYKRQSFALQIKLNQIRNFFLIINDQNMFIHVSHSSPYDTLSIPSNLLKCPQIFNLRFQPFVVPQFLAVLFAIRIIYTYLSIFYACQYDKMSCCREISGAHTTYNWLS